MPRSAAVGLAVLAVACAPNEAPRVELDVVVDGSGLDVTTTDLGWTIEFQEVRLAIGDLEFTTAGEVHEARQPNVGARLLGLLLPMAHAHPGHYQGGEIIGELPGDFILDFIAGDGAELGKATLIVGEYTAANFLFRRAAASELPEGDRLIGHTALLAGIASKEGQAIAFSITIDSPVDRELVGAPFEYVLDEESMVSLGVQLLATDPFEGDHLFNGIDFAALDAADGNADDTLTMVDPESEPSQAVALSDAYNQIRRDFQTHDLFAIRAIDP